MYTVDFLFGVIEGTRENEILSPFIVICLFKIGFTEMSVCNSEISL